MAVKPGTLRSFAFLRHLSRSELARLATLVKVSHYAAGALIFPDRQLGDSFYLLKTGRVEIFKSMPTSQIVLNSLKSGDHFGEMSLLDNRPRSAAARAASNVTVVQIPKPVFLSLIKRFPILLYRAAQVNAERLRQRDRDLIRELGAHNQQLIQLYDTSLDIGRHRALHDALTAICQRAGVLLHGSQGRIFLCDESSGYLTAQMRGSERIKPGVGAVGRAFATGAPVIHRKAMNYELAVPVILDTEALGVLMVCRPVRTAIYTPDDAQLLMLFANQAAIAIENARLFALAIEKERLDHELQVALKVQWRLIPSHAPRIPGFQLAGVWRPAREVGGDFYDFISLDNGRWAFVIADVVDKGMAAALLMMTARSVIRASVRAALTAVAAIEHANRLIAADAGDGTFITVFLGILDPQTCRIEYVNAGHNPPMCLRAQDHRIQRLHRTGMPLGVDGSANYQAREITLAKRDSLLLFTDGVTDALDEHIRSFSEARLVRSLKPAARGNASAVVQTIDRAVREFVGKQPLFDDLTIVALSVQR